MTVEKPPIILSDWNEERGPLIIDSIFPEKYQDMDDSPEVLVTRCYINAQSIFARAELSKTNYSIPMVSIKKLAIVFFDVVPDAKVRGGKRPFVLVIFAPINTIYGVMDSITATVEPFVEIYKTDTIPELIVLQDQLVNLFEQEQQKPVTISSAKPVSAVLKPKVVPVEEHVPSKKAPAKSTVRARVGPTVATPSMAKAEIPPEQKHAKPARPVKPAGAKPPARIKMKPAGTSPSETLTSKEVTMPGLRKFSTVTFKAKSTSSSASDAALTAEQQELIEKMKAKGWMKRTWSSEDLQKLKRLYLAGKDARDIAVELHRELKHVQEKIQTLKVKKKTS